MRDRCTRCVGKRRVRLSCRIRKDRRKLYCPARRTLCTPMWSRQDSRARTARICRIQNVNENYKLALGYCKLHTQNKIDEIRRIQEGIQKRTANESLSELLARE